MLPPLLLGVVVVVVVGPLLPALPLLLLLSGCVGDAAAGPGLALEAGAAGLAAAGEEGLLALTTAAGVCCPLFLLSCCLAAGADTTIAGTSAGAGAGGLPQTGNTPAAVETVAAGFALAPLVILS